mgnify:CR=1 FL=1
MQVLVDGAKLIDSGSIFIGRDSEIKFEEIEEIESIIIKLKFENGSAIKVDKKEEDKKINLLITNDTEPSTFGFANYELTKTISISLNIQYLTNELLKLEYTFLKLL